MVKRKQRKIQQTLTINYSNMAALLLHTRKCKTVEEVFMFFVYIYIIQPAAFNTETNETLCRDSVLKVSEKFRLM